MLDEDRQVSQAAQMVIDLRNDPDAKRSLDSKVLTREELVALLQGKTGMSSGVRMSERAILSALLNLEEKLDKLTTMIDAQIQQKGIDEDWEAISKIAFDVSGNPIDTTRKKGLVNLSGDGE